MLGCDEIIHTSVLERANKGRFGHLNLSLLASCENQQHQQQSALLFMAGHGLPLRLTIQVSCDSPTALHAPGVGPPSSWQCDKTPGAIGVHDPTEAPRARTAEAPDCWRAACNPQSSMQSDQKGRCAASEPAPSTGNLWQSRDSPNVRRILNPTWCQDAGCQCHCEAEGTTGWFCKTSRRRTVWSSVSGSALLS